ncbi:Microtubule associated protein (MAP65/ASE1 family) [Novymonas esmeraldas]|uniref:Microtubule associated protein (MAP65/ASE1 family) n=1 Tax=Novymonas esmeraldas TaxID=1808958 RepID=A0AAW0ES23_9TRYP
MEEQARLPVRGGSEMQRHHHVHSRASPLALPSHPPLLLVGGDGSVAAPINSVEETVEPALAATVDALDPRVAPAVQQLSTMARRVSAVWQRMGVASRDRQQRWNAFLFDALLPFLDDYCALQTAAERSVATENDALLREVCYTAARLDEAPRQPDVAAIVALLKAHYAETQHRHPFGQTDTAGPASEHGLQQRSRDGDSDSDTGDAVGTAAAAAPSHTADFMYSSLPSFTTVIATAPPHMCGDKEEDGDDDDDEQQHEHAQQQQRRRAKAPGSVAVRDGSEAAHDARDEHAVASRAVRRLMEANTHEGVRQLLQVEFDRLQRLADNRLRVLQLLCKQRAVLHRSAQEQVTLRAAYRAKYLGAAEMEESALDKLLRADAAASECSSGFVSPPTSPKASCRNGGDNSAEDEDADADAVAAHGSVPATSLRDTTRAELQLLLSAASCCLDPPCRLNSSSSRSSSSSADGEGSGEAAAPRRTVLDVDVSAITAYGTHQDLTLARIHAEAEDLVRCIDAHNHRMQLEADDELRALGTLEVLWRAMSAQRASSKTSAMLARLQQREHDDTADGEGGVAHAPPAHDRASLATIGASPLTPLAPAPFRLTTDEITARHAQLHAAYEADVAAQRELRYQPQQQLPSAAAMPTSASSAGSPPSSLTSSTRLTPPPPPLATAAAGGSSGALYLPPSVRQVLRAVSYAPVLDYVHRARTALQVHLSTQQDALVEKAMARLRDVYAAYHAATGDATYAVAPDGELRVAMEEELMQTLQASAAAAPPSFSPSSNKVLLRFQQHLTACQQVREQASDEAESLRLRLHIIQQAAPLVAAYQEILCAEAETRATSRERLLSKKVNMAKQLLQEEKMRRRVATELPRIASRLTELVDAWDALQAATDPREDTVDLLGSSSSGGGGNGTLDRAAEAALPSSSAPLGSSSSSAKVELWVHGQRVRDLLTPVPPTSTPPANTRARSRSVSTRPPQQQRQQQQQPSTSPSQRTVRSVSPTPPASVRQRTEPPQQQQRGISARGASPRPAPWARTASTPRVHRTSPTPPHTPLPLRGTPLRSAGRTAGEYPSRHPRPAPPLHGRAAVASERTRTPALVQQPRRDRSVPAASAAVHHQRSRSPLPPPLLPLPSRRGLAHVSVNAVGGKSWAAPRSASPSPSANANATARAVRGPRP